MATQIPSSEVLRAKSGSQLLDEKTVLALFQRMLHKYNGNAVDSDHVTRYCRS